MVDLLTPQHSKPLEREYEGWLVYEIEHYFQELGLKFSIWAVSPTKEKYWPADEHLLTHGKLIGLQLKKATLATKSGRKPDFSRLKWLLQDPKGQFELVQKRPEIFYCLPTFVNRNWRRRALDHALFWRPGEDVNYNAWYDNPNAQTPYKNLAHDPLAMRWGAFYEQLVACNIGKKLDSDFSIETYLEELRQEMERERLEEEENDESRGLYLVLIGL